MPNARSRAVAALVAAALPLAACQSVPESAPAPTPAPTPTATGTTGPDALDAGRSEPVADPVYPDFGNPAVDVLHYGLALGWSPRTRRLTGAATLTIRAARDTEEIRLDFAEPLRVEAVTLDGKQVTASRRSGDVVVSAGRRLSRDTRAVLAIRYSGRPQAVPMPASRPDIERVGLTVLPDGEAWSMQEPFGAFTWYPSNDQPSDEALYDVAITVPAGWAGVSGGILTGRTEAGGQVTYRWRAADPVASYLVALAIGRYRQHTATGPRGIPVTYWVRPETEARVLPQFRRIPAMLAWLEGRFGRYPFRSAGAVDVESRSGMETQTMVTLGSGFTEAQLLHELAHQWFGNAVSPRTWREVWLNEGFTMYAQMLYEASHGGPSQASALARWRAQDGDLRREHGPPGRYKPDHFASPNVYYCPALMLHEIRRQLGDRVFFRMMRDWVQENLHTSQDRASFTTWLNRYSGRDLSGLVNRWLDSPTTPSR